MLMVIWMRKRITVKTCLIQKIFGTSVSISKVIHKYTFFVYMTNYEAKLLAGTAGLKFR